MPTGATPLFDPAEFRIPSNVCHVCAGGETPFMWRHDEALQRHASDKSRGVPGRQALDGVVASTRAVVAEMWGVQEGDIGFVGSVAEGVSMVAESIDWQPGDNVCFDLIEYPSVVAPFARQRGGIALRFAGGEAGVPIEAIVDERTRIIGVSHVSYLDGRRYDLAAYRQLADSVGALLVIDFTQGAGYLPIDAALADFGFSSCYKWLLGMTGAAIAYWNRGRHPDWSPTTAGWHSLASGAGWQARAAGTTQPDYAEDLPLQPDALRFTRGNPAHGSIYVLKEALDYLGQFEATAITGHVQGLTTALLDQLAAANIPSTTPPDPAHHGASICINSPRAQAIVAALYEDGVFAWNGRGRIRFSFHGYNTHSDVERIMAGLSKHWIP